MGAGGGGRDGMALARAGAAALKRRAKWVRGARAVLQQKQFPLSLSDALLSSTRSPRSGSLSFSSLALALSMLEESLLPFASCCTVHSLCSHDHVPVLLFPRRRLFFFPRESSHSDLTRTPARTHSSALST